MSRLDAVEARALGRLQGRVTSPAVATVANHISSAGEHAWIWMVVSAAGATLDHPRRRQWAHVGTAAFVAHGGAVVLKRIVRRRRPHAPGVRVLDRTAGTLSFPSAHAASTTAAAVAATPLVGAVVTIPIAVAMASARLLLGVHYPTDVSAGALLGVLSARAVGRATGMIER